MGRPKKIKDDPYYHTYEDRVAMSWCFRNKMRCFLKPFQEGEYKVVVEYVQNGIIKEKESPNSYLKNNASRVMAGIYRHLYNKNVKNI
jgi:hypothetical protein